MSIASNFTTRFPELKDERSIVATGREKGVRHLTGQVSGNDPDTQWLIMNNKDPRFLTQLLYALLALLIFFGYGDRQRLEDAQKAVLAAQPLIAWISKQDRGDRCKGKQ